VKIVHLVAVGGSAARALVAMARAPGFNPHIFTSRLACYERFFYFSFSN